MPFATVERTHKRFRTNDAVSDHSSYYFTPPFPDDDEDFAFDLQQPPQLPQDQLWGSFQPWGINHSSSNKEELSPTFSNSSTFSQPPRRYPLLSKKQAMGLNIDTNCLDTIPPLAASSPPTPLETSGSSVDSEPTTVSPSAVPAVPWGSDEEEERDDDPAPLSKGSAAIQEVFSKFSLSYTDLGINMEARISSVSDFRVLVDAFSKMCCSPKNDEEKQEPPGSDSGIVLHRNPNSRLKPVNFFASASYLGQILHPHSKHSPTITLQQIVDACIQTYFTCWVRYFPIISKHTFKAWYDAHPNPLDTLIVNALCSFSFRHTALHHGGPEWEHFRADHYQLQEQEEFFFNRARDCLGQSFDCPDRFVILSLIYMSIRAEVRRRHHYLGMAVSMLHELEIYPRMVYEAEDESYEKEADTRMWWLAWSIDLFLYSAGAPKNTPQTKFHGLVDIPRVFEEDIDDDEVSVLTYHHCIQFWKMQASIIDTMHDQDQEMTVELLNAYDQRIVDMYNMLPAYLKFDSGFEYGSEELFVSCIRVNIEYNATRIILHKQFIPDVNDRYPGRFSLESLNICISVALTQLRALNTCVKLAACRCAFDRDEMWRTAEVISITMDIYRSCNSPLILTNIDKEEFDNALQKCMDVLQQTVEHRSRAKDWVQLGDWIEVEIRRHQLYNHPANNATAAHLFEQRPNKPDYFLATLKPTLLQQQEVAPVPVPQSRSEHDSHEITPSGSMLSVLSFPASSSPSSTTSSSSSCSSFIPSSSPDSAQPFVQCNMYAPPSKNINPSRSQTRFRYFNPRKMNKFLFIDENPIS